MDEQEWWQNLLKDIHCPFFEIIADCVQVSGFHAIDKKITHVFLIVKNARLYHLDFTTKICKLLPTTIEGRLLMYGNLIVEPVLSFELYTIPPRLHMLLRTIVARFTYKILTGKLLVL
jgi:hypothetical protein